MLRSLRLLTLASLVLFPACRGDDGGDDTTADARIDGPGVNGVTIQEIHNEAMVVGTAFELRGKVVTAIDTFGGRKGNFYIAEPTGGGEFSGVLVFGAPTEQVALLAVGDLVDIIDVEKDEFDGTETVILPLSITEVIERSGGKITVTKVGTGPLPAPHVLDALAVGQMAPTAREAELERWEGVLITVNNVAVTRGISAITSSQADDCEFREFTITSGLRVDSSLSAIPATLPMSPECPATTDANIVVSGDCVASITGMGDYFFNYKILPRSTGDIMTGGTGCAAPEATEALCMDTIDNDGNGFTDCDDLNCSSFCAVGSTIELVQTGAATGTVTLDNVIVTGVDTIGPTQGIWIQQAAQAAANQGVFVFTGNTAPAVTIGAVVDVTGNVDEFDVGTPETGDTLTEIVQATVTPQVGTMTPVAVPGIAVATLADIAALGEPYESVLVRLPAVRVMAETAPGDRVVLTDGTNTIVMDDDIFNYAAGAYPVGTCFSSAVGIMTVNLFDDQRRFLPRAATDLTMVTCP